jgi:uncharacterized protein YbaR (Trm112 family)
MRNKSTIPVVGANKNLFTQKADDMLLSRCPVCNNFLETHLRSKRFWGVFFGGNPHTETRVCPKDKSHYCVTKEVYMPQPD